MAVLRADILQNAAARDAYINGVRLLKREVLQPGWPSTYDLFVIWHYRAMMTLTPPGNGSRNAAHSGPAFLPWHRYMLIVLEQQLQRVLGDPNFGLPYWNWAADGDKPPAQQRQSPLWAANCMGGQGDPVSTGPFAFNVADATSWRVRYEQAPDGRIRQANRGLARRFSTQFSLPTSAAVRAVVQLTPYDVPEWDDQSDAFRNRLEGWAPNPPALHNLVHVWIGRDMGLGTSPNDPVFYLNHANVDRVWAAWQLRHGAPYVPDGQAAASLQGHRLNDTLQSLFANPPRVADMLDVSAIYSYDTLADLS